MLTTLVLIGIAYGAGRGHQWLKARTGGSKK